MLCKLFINLYDYYFLFYFNIVGCLRLFFCDFGVRWGVGWINLFVRERLKNIIGIGKNKST